MLGLRFLVKPRVTLPLPPVGPFPSGPSTRHKAPWCRILQGALASAHRGRDAPLASRYFRLG